LTMSGHVTQSPGLAVVMPFYFVFWQMKPCRIFPSLCCVDEDCQIANSNLPAGHTTVQCEQCVWQ